MRACDSPIDISADKKKYKRRFAKVKENLKYISPSPYPPLQG